LCRDEPEGANDEASTADRSEPQKSPSTRSRETEDTGGDKTPRASGSRPKDSFLDAGASGKSSVPPQHQHSTPHLLTKPPARKPKLSVRIGLPMLMIIV
jgi:hypothetical protein